MIRTYTYKLYRNDKTEAKFNKWLGICRYVYNAAKETKEVSYKEGLNVKGMSKNIKLSQAISDVGFGEFRRQIEYKAKWNGVDVVIANRFYPSSKLCSCCGHKKEVLKLSERTYNCSNCGASIDRDLNASKNLANLALLGNPEEVKLVEQTQIQDSSCGVALKQEFLLNNNLNN